MPIPTAEHPPSPFLLEQLPRLRDCVERGPILDLACGRGRHALALAREGLPCLAMDVDAEALAELAQRATRLPIDCVRANLETKHGLPLHPGRLGAILVFRFLYRPLARAIVDALAPGGLLVYETFTHHQAPLEHGPRREHFLLGEGELLSLFRDLEPLDVREGFLEDAMRPAHLARLVARKAER